MSVTREEIYISVFPSLPSTPRKVPSGHGTKSSILYLHSPTVRHKHIVRLSEHPLILDSLSALAPLWRTSTWDRTTGCSREIGRGGDDPRGCAAPTLLPLHGTARLVVTNCDPSPVACSCCSACRKILICSQHTLPLNPTVVLEPLL